MQQLIHYAVNSPLGFLGSALVLVLIFMWFIRSSPKILGTLIVLIILVLLAREAVHRMERAATTAIDNATNTATNAVPDWLKQLWQKVKNPFADFAGGKLCDYAGFKTVCDWYGMFSAGKKPLEQQAKDEQDIEKICKASAAVEAQFPDAEKTLFCAGNPFKRTASSLDSIGEGIKRGALSRISSFLVSDASKLDTPQYTNCLYTQITARNVLDCNAYRDNLHQWRLCAEFHLQLPHETVGGNAASASLDANILACREQAYNIQ